MKMREEWRTIPGQPYEASSLGRVRRSVGGPGTYAGRILSPRPDRDGYTMVCLHSNGERRGEKNGHSKITAKQVRAIRRRADAGETQRALGAAYGVSQSTIHLAINGTNWRHVR